MAKLCHAACQRFEVDQAQSYNLSAVIMCVFSATQSNKLPEKAGRIKKIK